MPAILPTGQDLGPRDPRELLEEFYRDATPDQLSSAITAEESQFLQQLVAGIDCRHSLEIGCGNGLSTLAICSARSADPRSRHVIIDPFQSSTFQRAGIQRLERAGIHSFELIERGSEYALPDLARRGQELDFAFIDGFHTLDHTIVDLFYVNRMLRVGGVVVIDDNNMRSVHEAIRYFASYPAYELIAWSGRRGVQRNAINWAKRVLGTALRPLTWMVGDGIAYEFLHGSLVRPSTLRGLDESTMVAFRKVDEDRRETDWIAYP